MTEEALIEKKKKFLEEYLYLCNKYKLYLDSYESIGIDAYDKEDDIINHIDLGAYSDITYSFNR